MLPVVCERGRSQAVLRADSGLKVLEEIVGFFVLLVFDVQPDQICSGLGDLAHKRSKNMRTCVKSLEQTFIVSENRLFCNVFIVFQSV